MQHELFADPSDRSATCVENEPVEHVGGISLLGYRKGTRFVLGRCRNPTSPEQRDSGRDLHELVERKR